MNEAVEPKRLGIPDFVFLASTSLFIYCQVFAFPFTPIYFDGDAFVPISNAIRMLDGEVLYKDFFNFVAPGTEVVYVLLFWIFGPVTWIPNLLIFALGLANVVLIWLLSRKMLVGIAVYIPALIFLVIGFRNFGIDASSRLFSVVFVLAALVLLIRSRSQNMLILAGVLCGMSSFFVQTRGFAAVVGICVFLIWENRRNRSGFQLLLTKIITVFGSFVLFSIAVHSYFAWNAGFENYYFAMVRFVQDHYRHDSFNNFGAIGMELPRLKELLSDLPHSLTSGYFRSYIPVVFYYLLIPCVYIGFFLQRLFNRHRIDEHERLLPSMLLATVGLFLAMAVSAPTAGRLYHVSAPAIIILVWFLAKHPGAKPAFMVVTAFLVCLGFSYSLQRQLVPKYVLEMPAGRSAFLDENQFQTYRWIGMNTAAGETFYEPYHPNYYFPFRLRNPTPLNLIRETEYTPLFQVESVVKALEQNPPRLIVWPRSWSKPADEKEIQDHTEPLWQFVRANYTKIHEFPLVDERWRSPYGDQEIWQLKD